MFFQVLHTGGKKDRDYLKLQTNTVQFCYIPLSLPVFVEYQDLEFLPNKSSCFNQ